MGIGGRRTKHERQTTDYRGRRPNISSRSLAARPPSHPRSEKKNAPARASRGAGSPIRCGGSAAIAEEAQQEQEQVDEVEVERQRAHDSLAADDGAVLHR